MPRHLAHAPHFPTPHESVVRVLVKARRWQTMLESGKVATIGVGSGSRENHPALE